MEKSLTQIMKEAGFTIKTESHIDRMGIFHIVKVKKDGKTTQRRERKYEDALALCALRLGII